MKKRKQASWHHLFAVFAKPSNNKAIVTFSVLFIYLGVNSSCLEFTPDTAQRLFPAVLRLPYRLLEIEPKLAQAKKTIVMLKIF